MDFWSLFSILLECITNSYFYTSYNGRNWILINSKPLQEGIRKQKSDKKVGKNLLDFSIE